MSSNQRTPSTVRRGASLRDMRQCAGLSAMALGYHFGVSTSFIYSIERGERPVDFVTVRQWAALCMEKAAEDSQEA